MPVYIAHDPDPTIKNILTDGGNVAISGECCCGAQGICCQVDGLCVDGSDTMNQAHCEAANGTWHDNKHCSDIPNPCRGACCDHQGRCSLTSETECDNEGGDYQGDGTTCDNVHICDNSHGACCKPNCDCYITNLAGCTDGTFYPGGDCATSCAQGTTQHFWAAITTNYSNGTPSAAFQCSADFTESVTNSSCGTHFTSTCAGSDTASWTWTDFINPANDFSGGYIGTLTNATITSCQWTYSYYGTQSQCPPAFFCHDCICSTTQSDCGSSDVCDAGGGGGYEHYEHYICQVSW